MKKRHLLLLLVTFIILFDLTGCLGNKSAEVQKIYVSLRHSTDMDNVQCLKWIVENRSDSDVEPVTFKKGDILNYKITHHNSGRIYASNSNDNSDITLKSGKTYETTVKLKDLPQGHYDALFCAKWGEDKTGRMLIYFDVEPEDEDSL